uniref:Uncharacterized protein n=1 Tax=Clastoptera arizonana TaxID=38151 RepID=A0A1B6E3N5_9HEMI
MGDEGKQGSQAELWLPLKHRVRSDYTHITFLIRYAFIYNGSFPNTDLIFNICANYILTEAFSGPILLKSEMALLHNSLVKHASKNATTIRNPSQGKFSFTVHSSGELKGSSFEPLHLLNNGTLTGEIGRVLRGFSRNGDSHSLSVRAKILISPLDEKHLLTAEQKGYLPCYDTTIPKSLIEINKIRVENKQITITDHLSVGQIDEREKGEELDSRFKQAKNKVDSIVKWVKKSK